MNLVNIYEAAENEAAVFYSTIQTLIITCASILDRGISEGWDGTCGTTLKDLKEHLIYDSIRFDNLLQHRKIEGDSIRLEAANN